MNCRGAKRAIILEAEGELTPAQEAALRFHCQACAACTAEAGKHRALKQLLARDAAPNEDPCPIETQRRRMMGGLDPRRPEGGWVALLAYGRPIGQGLALAALLLMCGFAGGWATRARFQPSTAVAVEGMAGLDQGAPDQRLAQAAISPTGVQRLLLEVVEHPANAGMRMDAIRLLSQAGAHPNDPESVQAALLQALRDDPNPGVRLRALAALTPLVEEDAAPSSALLAALAATVAHDANAGVRAQAVRALGQSPQAAPLLRRLGDESLDPALRLNCAAALQQLRAGVPSEWLLASAGGN